MKRIYMALLALALAPACSDDNAAGSAPTVTIDEQGLSPSTFSMPAYGTFWFVNDDSVPHQLYSHDCAELSTRIVMPGEEIEAFVGAGGATCHVQDMLAPLARKYWGIIEVDAEPAPYIQPSDAA